MLYVHYIFNLKKETVDGNIAHTYYPNLFGSWVLNSKVQVFV